MVGVGDNVQQPLVSILPKNPVGPEGSVKPRGKVDNILRLELVGEGKGNIL